MSRITYEAQEYANDVGDAKYEKDVNDIKKLEVKDLTNQTKLNVKDVNGYYRVGPFKWHFDGILQDIIVTGDNGTISSDKIRFIKYNGTKAKKVKVSDIESDKGFYIDVSVKSGATKISGLKLKTVSSSNQDKTKVYTAKIWFLHDGSYQNLIYSLSESHTVNPPKGEGSSKYNVPFTVDIDIVKVDDRDEAKLLKGVKFKFKTQFNIKNKDGKWEYVDFYLKKDGSWTRNSGDEFETNEKGAISLKAVKRAPSIETNGSKNVIEIIETYNPYYGYDLSKMTPKTVKLSSKSKISVKIKNHQSKIKLSGYVWLDTPDGKGSERNDKYDSKYENGFNGIKVYLKDKQGNTISTTTTAELGLYNEIKGGEYQFKNVEIDKLQDYHVEFEYCGIKYQSVGTLNLTEDNASKATDYVDREELDSKFANVEGNGTQTLDNKGVKVHYNDTHYDKELKQNLSNPISYEGSEVYARTDDAKCELDSYFTATTEEIRNINLGLYEKSQTDFAILQDLYNVKVSVNGFSHLYRYGAETYDENGNVKDDSLWNVGVKYQQNNGTYSSAIYKSDCIYEAPNHKDNELKVYATYKISILNESTYAAKINNIVNYADSRFEEIKVGTSLDKNEEISDDLKIIEEKEYSDKYKKYKINVDKELNVNEETVLYVQFKLNRSAVIEIMNNNELINNVSEINSYTTFGRTGDASKVVVTRLDENGKTKEETLYENKDLKKAIAVVDKDSVPGNAIPGEVAKTYEDDTCAARSLKLELKDDRSIQGTAFVDSSELKDNERLGNGIFDNGEKTIAGVKVKLHEVGKDDSSYDGERVDMETTTDESGSFTFTGYIPGNYEITYTWGDKTYKVQYYKGTIYDSLRDQNNKFWYKDDVDTRKTDALDNFNTRKVIDDEMEKIKTNTLESEINKAYDGTGSETIKTTTMDSTTPQMTFGVEYDTTITDGTADKVEFIVKNVDFGIVERPKQQIDISKKIATFKIVLANGQTLIDAKINENGKLEGTHNGVTYMGPKNINQVYINGMLKAEIDNEIIQGATLETTYTIQAENTGEIDYTSEAYYKYGRKEGNLVQVSVDSIIDYLDEKLAYTDTNDGTWVETNKEYLDKVNASSKDTVKKVYSTTKLAKGLKPGEKTDAIEFKTSKLLSSGNDATFENSAEITETSKIPADNTGTPVKVTETNGNTHFDIANAPTVVIVPPTGESKNYILPIIIGMTSLIVLGVGTFVIKKFVIDNK